jgi:DNA-binding transcriptional LysR family regulator
VEVDSRVLTNEPGLNLRLARAGLGLTLADDSAVEDPKRGDLVKILGEFTKPYPEIYLYYPQRQHASPTLRAFIDHLPRTKRNNRCVRTQSSTVAHRGAARS